MKESQIISERYTFAVTVSKPQCLISFLSSSRNPSNDSPDFCFRVASLYRTNILLGAITYNFDSVSMTSSYDVHSSIYLKTSADTKLTIDQNLSSALSPHSVMKLSIVLFQCFHCFAAVGELGSTSSLDGFKALFILMLVKLS